MVSLTVYDGAYGIGGNKLYLEETGSGVFLDFGKNFGKYGVFYEEFLKNRDTRGIHDLMYLDLLPKLNIYRPDLIPGDLSLSQYLALNVAGCAPEPCPYGPLREHRNAQRGYSHSGLAGEHRHHERHAGHRRLIPGNGHRLFLAPAAHGRPGPLSVIHRRRMLPG